MINSPISPQGSVLEEQRDVLQVWRETVFNNAIKAVAILGSIAYFIGIGAAYSDLTLGYFLGYTAAYLWVIATAFLKRIPTIYRASSFVTIILSLGILSTFERGAIGDGRIWLILAVAFAAIFLGRKAGLTFAILGVLIWAIAGYLFITMRIPQHDLEEFTTEIWFGTTITFLIAGVAIVLSVSALLSNLNKTVQEGTTLARKSKIQNKELEMQRSTLEKRSNALEMTAKISRQLATLIEHQDILEQMPKLLHKEFELHCAALFLLDTENTIRLASSSNMGTQAPSTDEYVLTLNEDIIGMAVVDGVAYSDKNSTVKLKMALEDTRSYTAIPLRGRYKVLGALALQSQMPDAFGDEVLSILQIFADQATLLLENANLLAEKEDALKAERRAYGKITQSAWGDLAKAKKHSAYRRDEKGASLVPSKTYHSEEKPIEGEQVPIQVRGKVIGYIDAHKKKNRAWTASEKELLSILSSRLETAMDGARLYQDSQERAERERIISETSARMRETLNVETVLETAVRELGDTFNFNLVKLQMVNTENNNTDENLENKDVQREKK